MKALEFKTDSSKKNWKQNKIGYIILIVLIVFVILWVNNKKLKESKGFSEIKGKIADGNGPVYARGRGNDNDTVDDLLNRIEWSTYLEKRSVSAYRFVGVTVISTALIAVLAMRKLPKIGTILIMGAAIFVPIFSAHQLYYVHGDAYNDYYMKDNVKRLREKIGMQSRYSVPPDPEDNIPTRVKVSNPY
jgi:hypothetical protein